MQNFQRSNKNVHWRKKEQTLWKLDFFSNEINPLWCHSGHGQLPQFKKPRHTLRLASVLSDSVAWKLPLLRSWEKKAVFLFIGVRRPSPSGVLSGRRESQSTSRLRLSDSQSRLTAKWTLKPTNAATVCNKSSACRSSLMSVSSHHTAAPMTHSHTFIMLSVCLRFSRWRNNEASVLCVHTCACVIMEVSYCNPACRLLCCRGACLNRWAVGLVGEREGGLAAGRVRLAWNTSSR